MKTVVFASIHDAARSKMAAAFFNAFTLPVLVRGVSGGSEPLLWVAPHVVQVMREAGLDISGRPSVVTSRSLHNAALIVTFAGAPFSAPPGVPREEWNVPDPTRLALEDVRRVRDQLRRRVWRMVAARGWYKLQPAVVAMRARSEARAHA